MDAREKEISALESQIAALEAQVGSEFVEIGKLLIASGYSGGRSAEMTAALEKSSSLTATSSQRKAEIRAVSDRLDQLKMIGDTLKGNERKVKTAQGEIESQHKEIGTAAYEAFKTKCENKERFKEIFDDMLRIEDEVAKKQKEIEAVETEGKTKGFFGRVKDRANIYLIKATIVKTEMGRGSALSGVGSKVLSSNFAVLVSDEALNKALEAPLAHKRSIAEITSTSESLKAQQGTLQAEIARLVGSDQNPVAKIKEWEKEVGAAEQEIASMFRSLGEQCFTQKLHEEIVSDDLKARATAVKQLRGDAGSKRAQIESLRAAIELDRAVAQCEELKRKKESLVADIQAKQKEIAAIEEQMGGNLKRQTELRTKAASKLQ